MKLTIVLVWAVTATAVALVLLGYTISEKSHTAMPVAVDPFGSTASDTQGGETAQQVDPYQIPPALSGLPAEWHSVFDGRHFRGYAILFDPSRREVIVEQCRHPGYPRQVSGPPRVLGWDFCTNVLWGNLTRIDEHSATAVDSQGDPVELQITVDREAVPPRLSLSFQDYDMDLVPGSKNDLLQAMDSSPAMLLEKERYSSNVIAFEQEQRRLAEQAGSEPPPNVPRYSLPDSGAAKVPPETSQ